MRLAPWVLLLLYFGGCVSPSHKLDDPNVFLGAAPAFESLRSYQRIQQTTPHTPDHEKEKINYLLDRLGGSPYRFIRHGIQYSGKRGAMHLRLKYVRRKKEIPTAEIFLEKIARGSRRTGERYWIEMDGKRYLLQTLLRNELNRLEDKLKEPVPLLPEVKDVPEV